MPNIAQYLKEEISRVAKRTLKAELDALRKTVTAQRGTIASLKKTVITLERDVRQLKKGAPAPARPTETAAGPKIRWNAAGFASLRKKLGLSRVQMGLLIGVSDQTIRLWELDVHQPRPPQLDIVAKLRKMGKREVLEVLATLEGATP